MISCNKEPELGGVWLCYSVPDEETRVHKDALVAVDFEPDQFIILRIQVYRDSPSFILDTFPLNQLKEGFQLEDHTFRMINKKGVPTLISDQEDFYFTLEMPDKFKSNITELPSAKYDYQEECFQMISPNVIAKCNQPGLVHKYEFITFKDLTFARDLIQHQVLFFQEKEGNFYVNRLWPARINYHSKLMKSGKTNNLLMGNWIEINDSSFPPTELLPWEMSFNEDYSFNENRDGEFIWFENLDNLVVLKDSVNRVKQVWSISELDSAHLKLDFGFNGVAEFERN